MDKIWGMREKEVSGMTAKFLAARLVGNQKYHPIFLRIMRQVHQIEAGGT